MSEEPLHVTYIPNYRQLMVVLYPSLKSPPANQENISPPANQENISLTGPRGQFWPSRGPWLLRMPHGRREVAAGHSRDAEWFEG